MMLESRLKVLVEYSSNPHSFLFGCQALQDTEQSLPFENTHLRRVVDSMVMGTQCTVSQRETKHSHTNDIGATVAQQSEGFVLLSVSLICPLKC